MKELSGLAQTIYSEMLEQALSSGDGDRARKIGGSFVSKIIDGKKHFYYQHREMGQKTVQSYLGPDDSKTVSIIEKLKQADEESLTNVESLQKLQRVFAQLGGHAIDNRSFKVIKGFADAGILRPGLGFATVIGTHAFTMMGNALGVQWESNLKTEDIDFAAEDRLEIAVTKPDLAAPTVLEQLNMGFIPVPSLNNRSPSTSYKIKGKELRVDLVTPQKNKSNGPIFVKMFGSPAKPLPFMDYLVEQTMPVVALGKRDAVVVNIPEPARFAVHKLILSENRPATFRAKAIKDRDQARQLISYFEEQSPYEFEDAMKDAVRRGPGWQRRILAALEKIDESSWAKKLAKEAILETSNPKHR